MTTEEPTIIDDELQLEMDRIIEQAMSELQEVILKEISRHDFDVRTYDLLSIATYCSAYLCLDLIKPAVLLPDNDPKNILQDVGQALNEALVDNLNNILEAREKYKH